MSPAISPTPPKCDCGNFLEKHGVEYRPTCWSCRHSPEQLKKKNQNRNRRRTYSLEARFNKLKSSAQKRGLDFLLTLEIFALLAETPCVYGGGTISVKLGSGIDRRDNSKGYVTDNVVPCCPKHNRIKGAWLDHWDMVCLLEKHPNLKTCGNLQQEEI